MKHLREFLNRQIEEFLNYEFGPGTQNMTPAGIRRMSWTPEHTARLVGHLAGNWEMVEQAQRLQQDGGDSGPRTLDDLDARITNATETVEVAADNAQADAVVAEWDDANPMAFSLTLLRFVQKLAAQVEGGIITAQYREEAKALLQQLAKVEARNDADRR